MSLLNFFIKPAEPENQISAPQKSVDTAKVSDTASRLQQNITTVLPPTGVAAIDQKFIDHFTQVMAKANQDGPDFFEFMQSLQNMENIGLTEDKAYQAAWAAFAAMAHGTDAGMLSTSAQKYKELLADDKKDFNAEVQNALTNDIGDLKNKITTLENQNKDAADQIIKLQATIQGNNENIAKINGQIGEKTVKINNGKNSYDVTFEAFTKKIDDTISKINLYIGGNK